VRLLPRRAADPDRVAAQEGGEYAGCHAQVDPGHLLANPVDIECAAAHAAEVLGNEYELDAEAFTQQLLDQFLWKFIVLVEFKHTRIGKRVAYIFANRVYGHFQGFGIDCTCHHLQSQKDGSYFGVKLLHTMIREPNRKPTDEEILTCIKRWVGR
jgi:hypothetical protein